MNNTSLFFINAPYNVLSCLLHTQKVCRFTVKNVHSPLLSTILREEVGEVIDRRLKNHDGNIGYERIKMGHYLVKYTSLDIKYAIEED